jgi:3-dehydroquinate synthase
MQTLQVDLGEHSYPIHIRQDFSGLADSLKPHLPNKTIVIISNETVWPLYGKKIKRELSSFNVFHYLLTDGEEYKTLETFAAIHTFLLENSFARDVTLVALGGGVVGDITGFVAATYQRGVNFIQIPTTLLAQVDSSVGGKTAVNHPLGKNMIGAFYQPTVVYIATDVLATLPDREFSAGLAEVVKYGILGDASFFADLEVCSEELLQKDQDLLTKVIHRCCALKAEIVAHDEKEQGLRAILNLGHTFGHAIEAEQGYGNWLHGEAVAAGLVQSAELACSRDWVSQQELTRIKNLLTAFNLPVAGPRDMTRDDYIKHMKKDKKVADSKMRFVLPKPLGQAILVNDVTEQELTQILA